ncbi:uncharacterized protein MONBRDRAFT_31195 [Monosiga brevicollis MX1]|uniref:Uncharacterized protein n=1 Tax=Monosiga brevicollis TaxID=81824 RepID=A9USA1_MONBE|nr:uncharacterized protein MONBRDRAFT_31195 [Monosiga brevicollis MX1]EDQ91745.1 predicted protein [Monosiga brevicollis MX1]|eukprot:XP_001743031.1 hypothetical protein [Monosiga brevicollis MX1]
MAEEFDELDRRSSIRQLSASARVVEDEQERQQLQRTRLEEAKAHRRPSVRAAIRDHFMARSTLRGLDVDGFVEALRPQMHHADADTYLRNLYEKMRVGTQLVSWVPIQLPAKIATLPQRSNIRAMSSGPKDRLYVLQENATLTIWNSSDSADTWTQKHVLPSAGSTGNTWVTDMVLLPTLGRIAVCAGERELWFYDMRTLEPHFALIHLADTPMKMVSFTDPESQDVTLVIGDHAGCLNAIQLPPFCLTCKAFKESQRQGKLQKTVLKLSIDKLRTPSEYYGNITYSRWQVHNDWVSGLTYLPWVRLLASTSNDEATGMVIGEVIEPVLLQPKSLAIDPDGPSAHLFPNGNALRRNAGETVFRINKGVKALAFSSRVNVVVTAGLDRVIRLWNPYVSLRPSGSLEGHNTPVLQLAVQEERDRLFSCSADREIRAWHLVDMTCLIALSHRRHAVPLEPSCMFWHVPSSSLMVGAETLCQLVIKASKDTGAHVQSHDCAVVCSVFSRRFGQLVTGDQNGQIKSWDAHSGAQIFEFDINEGDEGKSDLTHMVLDASDRRLVTAQANGSLRIWNYNNGQLLRTLDKGTSLEVMRVAYVTHGMLRTIVCGGWDRRLFVFKDSPEDDLSMAPNLPISARWPEAERHDDDIVTLAVLPPNLAAAASYNGEIIIWNLVSAAVVVRLATPINVQRRVSRRETAGNVLLDSMLENSTVTCISFIHNRPLKPGVARLVAGGTQGTVVFWSWLQGGRRISSFTTTRQKPTTVTSLDVSLDGETLAVGDADGWIRLYNLTGYAYAEHGGPDERPVSSRPVTFSTGLQDEGPDVLAHWKGHLQGITNLSFRVIETTEVVISCSKDGCVRLWDHEGSFIATLGDPEIYDAEEADQAAREEESRFAREMAELGIYDDDDTSAANDIESVWGSRPASRFASASPLDKSSYAFRQIRSETLYAPTSSRIKSAPTFQRLSAHGNGSWERHLNNVPYRPESGKVYMSLPYHHLDRVEGVGIRPTKKPGGASKSAQRFRPKLGSRSTSEQ